jgi:hypothetical protein
MGAAPKLMETRIRGGVWEGLLTGAAARPDLRLVHDEHALGDVELHPLPGREGDWSVKVPIPMDRITDGVQTFLIEHAATGEKLAAFSVSAGEGADADLRAEVDLLRAELDLLKRAFRRHCVETGAA